MPVRGAVAAVRGAAGDIDDAAFCPACLPVEDSAAAEVCAGGQIDLKRAVPAGDPDDIVVIERAGFKDSGVVDQHIDAAIELVDTLLPQTGRDCRVRKVLGDPDNANAYMTGKSWIPFYYGPDTHRTDWMYKGKGRVVFSRNRYSGGLKVIRILHNPNELE